MHLYHYFEYVSLFIEVVGVTIIFGGVVIGIIKAALSYIKNKKTKHIYTHIRQEIAHAILLGLEVLIAVDIIKTVTTELTLENTLTLALIVIIRTVLSISLEVEIEHRFPWSKKELKK